MPTIADETYVPPPHGGSWLRAEAGETGLDPAAVEAAKAYAASRETPWSRDVESEIVRGFSEPPPWNEIIGPVAPRGGPNGLVLHRGLIVAEWGDTGRVDMSFSIAKSYLGLLAGIAVERGLIRDLDEKVARLVDDGGFDPPHNAKITWRHLLEQTSEWEGTLWDKPDLIDRNRDLGNEASAKKGTARELREPGEYWEYNDIRVNRLALALLQRFRRPLPEVFREAVMAPIGASAEWRWHGYRNSFVEIDGVRMESVSGGGHWGGGVFMHARDHARLGLLALRRGRWGTGQLISEAWIRQATTPTRLNPQYGFFWILNTGRKLYPSAPADAYGASGSGGNLVWVDPSHDIVAVLCWIDPATIDGFLGLLAKALPDKEGR
ncbi:MAG TPA: serine hydrolase [Alphaproteobacteria bacterium]|nr:serine hydrolase [Alphaproteobacteria bacterium]